MRKNGRLALLVASVSLVLGLGVLAGCGDQQAQTPGDDATGAETAQETDTAKQGKFNPSEERRRSIQA